MSTDSRSLSQEHFLLETVRRLESAPDAWTGLQLHLSLLRPDNRRPYHIRVVANFMKPIVERYRGQIFMMNNADLIMVLRDAAQAQVDQALDKVKAMFADDPLTAGGPGADVGRFASYYPLDQDYPTFRTLAERLYAQARKRLAERGDNKGEDGLKPLLAEHLPSLMTALNTTDVSALLHHQPICVVMPNQPPEPVLWEVIADLDEICGQILPGIDLASNRWYRMALRDALLDRQMAWLYRRPVSGRSDPICMDATVAGLMSEQFLTFDAGVPEEVKKRIVFELSEAEVYSNLGSVMFLRDYVQARGYRMCLDGLNHLTLPLIDRTELGFDFLKLHWGPDFQNDVRDDRTQALANAIRAAGESRVILYHCDSARAIDCGRALGITLFQGSYIDTLIKPAPGRHVTAGIAAQQ